jgi:hypothetical protein
VKNCQDDHLVRFDKIKDAIREALDEGPPDLMMNFREESGVLLDESEAPITLQKELVAEAGQTLLIPPVGFPEIGFRLGA